MKHKFSLILILAFLSTTFAWAQTTSAYYEVPEGAFFAGMTENGSAADKTFYLPYNYGQKYIFTSTEDGTWTSGNGSLPDKKEYSYSNRTMKDSCHTPLLAVEGKAGYQYGASGESYDENLYFHIGDSVMHYMTPARIYDETGNISQKAIDNYYTKTRDTIGVFFNTDVMYIDSISIPISFGGSSGYSLETMFPSDAKVYAKIYQATQATGKSGNKFDRTSTPLRTIELTQECFKKHPSIKYRGVLTATVGEQPLPITGPFVIELTNMKKAECKFYIYAAKGRSGSNKWGYYVNGTTMTYPGDYTPAISVRAMFPALYTDGSTDVKIPAEGASKTQKNRPSRKVYSNYTYYKYKSSFTRTATKDLGIALAYNDSTKDYINWLFTMSANTTPNVREGYVTFKFRGKQLKFHLIQPPTVNSITISKTELSLKATETATLTASVLPEETTQEVTWVSEDETIAKVDADGIVTAVGVGTTIIKAISADPDIFATCTVTVTATLTPRTGTDHDQAFTFLAAGDDTLHINGIKTTKIYLDCEIPLSGSMINVVSKQGLTKIQAATNVSTATTGFVRLTLTRKSFISEEAKDTIVVSFKDNPEIKYEYYITQAGVGKLSTNYDYRTIVFGPQGSRNGLFLNDKGELPGINCIAIQAEIAPLREYIRYNSDLAQDDRFYNPNLSIKNEGTDDEYVQVFPSTLNNTDVKLEDNLYIFIPNVDTVAIHIIQEPTPRVWQLFGDVYTEMEVGNKGGKARFKGYTNTEMTLYSNTSVTADEISFTYTNETDKEWVHPSAVIKPCSKLTKDTVILTFNVDPWNGIESRSTNITITVQGKDFVIPLTQKTFGITLSHQGDIDTLVVPVAGGKAFWKGTNHPDLYVEGTEAYGDNLLQVTYPDGVEITRQASMYNTGRKRTTFTFSKTGTVTEDWSDSIFISFDSINEAASFEYHFKDTIIITQAAAKVWLADGQQPLVIAAEGGASNEFTIWSNMNIPLKDWTVFQKPTWVDSVTNVSSGPDGANYYRKLKANAAANTDTEKREGKITIKHKTLTNLSVEITISQEPQSTQTYTRTVTSGKWGTICLPYAAKSFTGAEMYSIAGKMEGDAGIYLDQVEKMEAGKPYIFKATAEKIEVVYAAGEPQKADTVNGLYGYIGESEVSSFTVPKNENNYIVYDNALYFVDSDDVTIASNRAYINYNEVGVPSQAPQIRRVAMPINGAPANILQVNDTKQAAKILRDGHIVILRADKEYDILGQSK